MFKAARWRSEKNKIKAVFKFKFHATQVPHVGWETMVVSLVPLDAGKPTLRSEKAEVANGACQWVKPVYETTRFSQDPKSGKINEKVYLFLVSATGSAKAGLLGETRIDLADYAEAFKPSSVSLPLKASASGAILHVTVQRMQGDGEGREADEKGDVILTKQRRTLQSQLSNSENDEAGKPANGTGANSRTENLLIHTDAQAEAPSRTIMPLHNDSNGELRKSNSFDDMSGSCSESSSSGQYTPKTSGISNSNSNQDSAILLSSLSNGDTHQNPLTSSMEWSVGSALEGSMDGLTNSSGETRLRERLQDPNISLEKLRSDAIALARQLEVSGLELQSLRKQVVKESKRGQDLSQELSSLKEERDALVSECEELTKISQKKTSDMNMTQKSKVDGEDLRFELEEIKQELNHEKNFNANLWLQLQKTQESNSELLLAVRDLEDELLEQKDKETSGVNGIKTAINQKASEDFQENRNLIPSLKCCKCNKGLSEDITQDSDEEQCALEVLVKEHDGLMVTYTLEQQIIDLKGGVEQYRKDREDLEMQMEQLALDYEILKQENHDISSKLEQTQLREQLMMQSECSTHLTIINDLESQIEGLEKELVKQAEAFVADLATITRAKIEQEQRAIRTEEVLQKTRWSNANAAERLQEEFKRLSAQVSSAFHGNEKLAMQSMQEASELRLEKCHLEELLRRTNEELSLVQDQYHEKLQELSDLLDMKTNEAKKFVLELENQCAALENEKNSNEAMQRAAFEEMMVLRAEIDRLEKDRSHLLEQVNDKGILVTEMERLEAACKESERMLDEGNLERKVLERELASAREEANKMLEELHYLRHSMGKKETRIKTLDSEVETLKLQSADLNHSLFEDEKEKENLRKQVVRLRYELQKKDDMIASIEKKLKESTARLGVSDGAAKTIVTNKNTKPGLQSHHSKEVATLKEKVRLLEEEIKLKDAKLEDVRSSFSIIDKDLNDKIEALESSRKGCIQDKASYCEGTITKETNTDCMNLVNNIGEELQNSGDTASMFSPSNFDSQLCARSNISGVEKEEETIVSSTCDGGYIAKILSEVAALKERNESMEAELKDMQQRYSDISLKFAEVEGERQQLVMTVRSLKNASKN